MIEIPPGAIVGLLDDFWQRSLADVGLPGPDAGNGGTFLLLPPGYDGEVLRPATSCSGRRCTTTTCWSAASSSTTTSPTPSSASGSVKVYPWSERENPTPNTFVSISGALIDTTPPGGLEFWARLATVIDNNPVQEHDRFFMAMLKPLGIEKGKPFEPDARQQAILEEAAVLGDAMARNVMYENTQRRDRRQAVPGHPVGLGDPGEARARRPRHYSQLDERLQYTYGAIYLSPAIGVMKAGPGANYMQTFRDKDGDHFDGGRSYRLHVPPNPPAAAFWSLTLYDSATRSMVQNPTNDAAHSSYDELKTNADGSLDLYFGPEAPTGQESNWIETVPGRGYYPMFRLYSPTGPCSTARGRCRTSSRCNDITAWGSDVREP